MTTTYEMAVAGVALVLAGALRGERLDLSGITAESWWAWAYLIAASISGYSVFTWLLGHVLLSLTSTYAYVNPVVAVLLGFVVGASPSPATSSWDSPWSSAVSSSSSPA